GLRGEVVDLVRSRLFQQSDQRELIEEVGLPQVDAVTDVLDALEVLLAGASDHPVDGVAFFEQEFREIRPVLSGDAGDQCATNGRCLPLPSPFRTAKLRAAYDILSSTCKRFARAASGPP